MSCFLLNVVLVEIYHAAALVQSVKDVEAMMGCTFTCQCVIFHVPWNRLQVEETSTILSVLKTQVVPSVG